MSGKSPPFVSIVVPFHNSAHKCADLLKTLLRLDTSDDVELILVDDGSTDGTQQLLNTFGRICRAPVSIVERDNGGPGAARNSGLERANGRYVWFVDSDDDIDLGAIAFARAAGWPEVDLIAWEWDHPFITRRLSAGFHDTSAGPVAPDVLDPIVANWYSTSFLRQTGVRFPEYCVYEATPIEAFVLPLLVSTYVKSDFGAYRANTQCSSVTRDSKRLNPRHLDRLQTNLLGMAFLHQAKLNAEAREPFNAAFAKLFLWYSIRLSRLPGRSWVLATRVMRSYRDAARRFDIAGDPFPLYEGRAASQFVLRQLWRLSANLPSQDGYFERLHLRAWGRQITWQPPTMPDRWQVRS